MAVIRSNDDSDRRINIARYLAMSNEELNNLPKYDRPDLADLHNFEMTKDPSLGYPPSERIYEAFEQTRKLTSKRRTTSEAKWVERGPNNFGGRTRAVMFDPNDPFAKKVWAAGVGGGLWVNEDILDEYSEWTPIDDFFGNISVCAMAYDPNSPQVFYFGTGEGWGNVDAIRGSGIWKSEDGGANWNQLPSTAEDPQFHFIQKIAVTNNSTLLAATKNSGGILRSTDGGETWNRVIEEMRGADIEIVDDLIYASTGVSSQGKMWKSQDDGKTWKDITPASGLNRIEIGVHPNHPNTVYAVGASGGDIGGFYRSYDAGQSWKSIEIPSYYEQGSCTEGENDFARGQAWYDLIVGVDPVHKNSLIVGGIDLYKSTDGGIGWDLISYWTGACDVYVHADQHNFIFRPGYPDEALVANDGGLFYTKNFSNPQDEGGPFFMPRNNGLNIAQFYSCAMINEAGRNYFLAGAQDNGSHQFFNPGVNSTNEITGGDGAFCFIDQDSPNFQITSYVYNSYWITTDFWETNKVVKTKDQTGRFINPAEYNSNTNTLFAAADDDAIVRYVIAEGEDIVPEILDVNLSGQSISALTNSVYDNDIMYVGTGDGGIFKLSDINGGIVATSISNGLIPEEIYISSIAVGSTIDHLVVTASNYGIVSVYETKDGGVSWSEKEGNLPDIPIRWALFNPSNYEEVLLATELGVWATHEFSSESPAWIPINDGLANVRCDMLKYRGADGLVAVATHGRGLYTSDLFSTKAVPDFTGVDLAYAGQAITFQNASIKGDSYAWDFGDGRSSTDMNPTHIFEEPGVYDVSLALNGDPDLVKTKEIRVLPYLKSNYSLVDGGDFESNTDQFYPVTIRGTGFELGSSNVTGKAGTSSGTNAWVTGLSDEKYAPYTEAYLYSPMFDFSLSGVYTLQFYTNYQTEDEWEGFTLEFTLDNGASWKKLGNFTDETWYNQQALSSAVAWKAGEYFFSGETDGFELKSIQFDELSNNKAVGFRFVFRTDGGAEFAGIAIDDFTISGPSSVDGPEVSFVSDKERVCLGEVVTFTNSSKGNIDAYSWDFGPNAIPASAVGYGPHSIYFTAGGTESITLTANTSDKDVQFSVDQYISNVPEEVDVITTTFESCARDSINITLQNTEKGITYSLYDVVKNEMVGKTVVGDGTIQDLSSGALASGLNEFKILAMNNDGCSRLLKSFITANVKKNHPVVIIEFSPGQLKASPGDAYQWYLDGESIAGANEIEYRVSDPGTYTVGVTFGDCVSYSEGYTATVLATISEGMGLNIFPNPVRNELHLEFDAPQKIINLEIFSIHGSKIFGDTFDETQCVLIDSERWRPGIYQLRILTQNGAVTKKILKQ